MKANSMQGQRLSRLWLEALDQRVVPSRSYLLGLDLDGLTAQVGLSSAEHSDDSDETETSSTQKSEKEESANNGNAYGRWASRVLGANYYATDSTVSPVVATDPYSSISVLPEVDSHVVNDNPSEPEPTNEQAPVSQNEAPNNTSEPPPEETNRSEVKPIDELNGDNITPIPERIDDPESGKDPAPRPPLYLPGPERNADSLPPARTAPEGKQDAVPGSDESQPACKRTNDSDSSAAQADVSGGTFVVVNAAPNLAAVVGAPVIVALEEAAETLAPAAVQAAGAMSQFVPFDPEGLQGSVQQFIDSLRTKNLEEGATFSFRQVAAWTTGMLGAVVTGELLRRKKVMKRSREWLSLTLSKWLTLPVKD